MQRKWKLFLDDYENNVEKVYYALRYRTWVPAEFNVFYRNERGKVREIYSSDPFDQVVDNVLTDCLKYVFMERKNLFHPCAYGSIPGKGQHEMRSMIFRKIRHRTDLFALVEDTRKFYPTINHRRMMEHCRKHIKDEWMLWLIETTINRMPVMGIALGLSSSNILGHVYHAEIDWAMYTKYKVRRYFRFCDDKFLIHRDSNYLHTIAREMIRMTEENGQSIKPDWKVVNVGKQPFKCLGGMISARRARLTTASRRRIERAMRRYERTYDPMAQLRSWSGIKGSLKNLQLDNLFRYWRAEYPEYFRRLRLAYAGLAMQRASKRAHDRMERILRIAADCRSAENKMRYPLAA